jgi:hypothetical protein
MRICVKGSALFSKVVDYLSPLSKQAAMADIELVRQSLISCLHGALPAHTPEGYPSVLGPDARGGLWAEATLPYNLRLADTVGPLAVVYRESPQARQWIDK